MGNLFTRNYANSNINSLISSSILKDYKTAELGSYELNWTSLFIDFFAKIGWAYDLKTVSHKVIEDRVKRTGDGTHLKFQSQGELTEVEKRIGAGDGVAPWGWGDKDIPAESIEVTETLYKKDD